MDTNGHEFTGVAVLLVELGTALMSEFIVRQTQVYALFPLVLIRVHSWFNCIVPLSASRNGRERREAKADR
jgi:hypothetical protein